MNYLIYQTTNTINGKIYIGCHKTTNINDGYQGSGKHLLRAIKKYGKENFITIILNKCNNIEDMLVMEERLVTESFIKRNDTYNLKTGGDGGFDYINNISKAEHSIRSTKAGTKWRELLASDPILKRELGRKISEGLKKYYKTHSGTFLDKRHTEETKQKIRVAARITAKGSRNSQYGTMWITNETNSKKIKISDNIPTGWRPGRKIK